MTRQSLCEDNNKENDMVSIKNKDGKVIYIVTDDRLIPKNSLVDSNLRGADLTNANLSNLNLEGVSFVEANLTNANLSGSNLAGAKFVCANLNGVDLSDAHLWSAKFCHANMTNANLSHSNISDADFTDANLTGAELTGSFPNKANFSSADLTGVIIYGIEISNDDLNEFKLRNLVMEHLCDSWRKNNTFSGKLSDVRDELKKFQMNINLPQTEKDKTVNVLAGTFTGEEE
jgi:uncharacterized protein YjbI with pentapeptide repeats